MKLGRPKSLFPRNVQVNLKFTKFEAQKIADVAKKFNLSKTEAIIKAIDLLNASKPKILRSQLKPKKNKSIKKVLPIINTIEEEI